MGWLKDIITDLIVTAVIIFAVYLNHQVLTGVVFGYSLLMLIAKAVVYFGDFHLQMLQKVKTDAPDWVSHLLYGINVVALLSFKWWYTGGIWIFIWLVSWATQRKINSNG